MDLKLRGTTSGGYIIHEMAGSHGTDILSSLTWLSLEGPGQPGSQPQAEPGQFYAVLTAQEQRHIHTDTMGSSLKAQSNHSKTKWLPSPPTGSNSPNQSLVPILVCPGHHNKIPHTEQLKQQAIFKQTNKKSLFSPHFWKLELSDQDAREFSFWCRLSSWLSDSYHLALGSRDLSSAHVHGERRRVRSLVSQF